MIRISSLLAAALLAVAAPLAAAAEELNLFAWSEYVPQSVLDGFTKATGIEVNYETYASNEEMLAKLMSGAASYDLVQPSEYTVEAMLKMRSCSCRSTTSSSPTCRTSARSTGACRTTRSSPTACPTCRAPSAS